LKWSFDMCCGGFIGQIFNPVEEQIAKPIEKKIENVLKNPLPIIETAVLTAVLAPVVGPAAAPSVASAAVTYINGGSTEDALKSGVVTFAGQQAGEAFAPAAQKPDNIDVGGGFNPATGAGDPTTAAAAAAVPSATEKSGVSGAARGATSAALKGGSAKDILTGGVVGGLSSAGGEAATESLGLEPGSISSNLTKSVVGGTISDIFAPQRSAQTVGGSSMTAPTSVTTTGAGQSPGSQALSQALRIGDPGAPILGSSDKEGGAKESGWNVSSLRYMGQES
jgi:hypothetical protein